MREVKQWVFVAMASLLVAAPAFANADVEAQIAEMRAHVEGLKQRIEAQEEQIEHQGELLGDAQRAVRLEKLDREEGGTLSALSDFWGGVDVGLSSAASYAYNFNNPESSPFAAGPGAGVNSGNPTPGGFAIYPFHSDHNSFQVDQVYFDIGKDPTEESRAGFQFSLLFGNTAANLGQGAAAAIRRAALDSTSDYYVYEAYVSFLAPLGEGVQVDAGKFATLIGAEVADTSQNFNITMGNVFQLFQPIDHTGVLASTTSGPLSFAAGFVNQGALLTGSPDVNKEKAYLASIGFAQDRIATGVTLLYAADGGNSPGASLTAGPGDNGQEYGLLDVLASYTGDDFEAWVNADYLWIEDSAASAWGIAVAGRVPLSPELSAAIRVEYANDKKSSAGGNNPGGLITRHGGALPPAGQGVHRSEVYGVTGTLAYDLAQNLVLRGEVRWDRVKEAGGPPEAFLTHAFGGKGDDDQVVGLVQAVYAF